MSQLFTLHLQTGSREMHTGAQFTFFFPLYSVLDPRTKNDSVYIQAGLPNSSELIQRVPNRDARSLSSGWAWMLSYWQSRYTTTLLILYIQNASVTQTNRLDHEIFSPVSAKVWISVSFQVYYAGNVTQHDRITEWSVCKVIRFNVAMKAEL